MSGAEFTPVPDAITVTVLVPAGVPGVLFVPPPQAEAPDATKRRAIASQICPYFMDGFFRRRRVMRNAMKRPGTMPKAAQGPRPNGDAAKELCFTGVGWVVAIVRVTVWLLLQPVSAIVVGLKMQELPAGRPVQEKVMLPV